MRTLAWTALVLTLVLGSVAPAAAGKRTVGITIEASDLRGGARRDAGSRAWVQRNGCVADEGGYVIGRALGGASGRANVAPMDSKLNREKLAAFEKKAKAFVREWETVDVWVTLHFDDSVSKTRPTRFFYKLAATNGPSMDEWFDNPLPPDSQNPCVCAGVLGNAAKLKTTKC